MLGYVAFIGVSAFFQLLRPSEVAGVYGADDLLLGAHLFITWQNKEDKYEHPTKHLAIT